MGKYIYSPERHGWYYEEDREAAVMEKGGKVDNGAVDKDEGVEKWVWWFGLISRILLAPFFIFLCLGFFILSFPSLMWREAMKFGMTPAERETYDREHDEVY